jgi:trypsin-like peptidase
VRAKFLLSYFLKGAECLPSAQIDPFAYNQGLKDAESYFRGRVEEILSTKMRLCDTGPIYSFFSKGIASSLHIDMFFSNYYFAFMNSRHFLSLTACVFVVAASCLASDVPQENLKFPILVRLENGAEASGFYFATQSNTFFVTAAHVLFDGTHTNLNANSCTLLSWTTGFEESDRSLVKLNLAALLADSLIKCAVSQDLAVVKISIVTTNGLNVHPTKYVTLMSPPAPFLVVSNEACQQFKDVQVGNEIYIFGYPSSLGMENVPQLQRDRPLLRKGIIAGKNYVTKTLIADSSVYYGNSGGPVFLVNARTIGGIDYRLVGVVSQFVPFEEDWINTKNGIRNLQLSNSGYAVIASLDELSSLINSLAAVPFK